LRFVARFSLFRLCIRPFVPLVPPWSGGQAAAPRPLPPADPLSSSSESREMWRLPCCTAREARDFFWVMGAWARGPAAWSVLAWLRRA
jgi:hypothetical protein